MLKNCTYSLVILVLCLFSGSLSGQECSILRLADVSAEQGDVVCVDLTASGFSGLAAMQGTIGFDGAQLKFKEYRNLGLPGLSTNNFGNNPAQIDNGFITMSWTAPFVEPAPITDGLVIVSFCFEVLGEAGRTSLHILNDPTPIELINEEFNAISIGGISGAVNIGEASSGTLFVDDLCVEAPSCSSLGLADISFNLSGGTAPFSYRITGPNGFESDQADFDPYEIGDYRLEVTDQNGQTAVAFIHIQKPDRLDMVTGTLVPVPCDNPNGGAISLNLEGDPDDYEFLWSTGATTQSLDNLQEGTYRVTITNTTSGCRELEVFALEQKKIEATIYPGCLIDDDQATLRAIAFNAANGPYSFTWSTGETSSGANEHTIQVPGGGDNVSVTITDNRGCQSVFETPIPFCTPNNDGNSVNSGECFSFEVEQASGQQGDIVCVDVVVNGFDAILGIQHSVNWAPEMLGFIEAKNFNVGNVTTSFGISAENLATGDVPFAWIDSGSSGLNLYDETLFYTLCFEVLAETGFAAINITETSTPIEVIARGSEVNELKTLAVGVVQGGIEIGGQSTSDLQIEEVCVETLSCASEFLAEVAITVNGGSLPYAFSWTGPEGFTSTQQNIQGAIEGMYNLVLTDQAGKQVSASAWLENKVGSGIVNGEVTPVNCANLNSGAVTLTGLSTGGDYSYSWSNGATTRDISGLSVGEYSVTVTSESNTCELTQTFEVALGGIQAGLFYTCMDEPTGTTSLVEVTALVFGGGAGPFTFVWSTGEEVVADSESKIQINAGDSVSVVITDTLGCTYTSQVLHTTCQEGSTNDLALSYAYDCGDDSTTVALTAYVWDGGTGPYNFFWSTGAQVSGSTQSTIEVPASGIYSVTVSDVVGNTRVLGGIAPNCSVANDTPLTLSIGEANATTGESICLAVRAKGFKNILGIQYAVGWDPAQVELNTVQAFALPNLNAQNFDLGSSTFQEGLLRFLWFDPTGRGLSLMDDAVLYEMCFTVLGTSGEVPIYFDQSTMQTEAINEDIASFEPVLDDGLIVINGDDRVWPGDTDNNELANQFDVLNIGLAYGATGPLRQDANLVWQGQWADDWDGQTPATAVNFKHIDVNGDGAINALDTTGLSLNWGRAANFSPNPFEEYRSTPGEAKHIGAPIFIETYTVRPGETADFNINLGDTENPVEGAYGIAFTIVYDPLAVVYGSAKASFQSSWLGTLGDNMIVVMKDDPNNHRIHVGLSRIDQIEVNGSGRIGILSLTIEDVIFRDNESEIAFSVENIRLIRSNEQEIIVNEVETVASINESPLDTENILAAQRLQLYPNPTTAEIFIQYLDVQMDYVQVFNTNGKLIKEYKAMNQISLAGLPSTTYLLRFVGPAGVVFKKVIKQ